MASTMNPLDLYYDPSLDGLINNGKQPPSRRSSNPQPQSRRTSGQVFDTADMMPYAPDVPRGPPVSYRSDDRERSGPPRPPQQAINGPPPQRSFSQRAKGRPFAKEAFEEDDIRQSAQNRSFPEQQPGPRSSQRQTQPIERIEKPVESPTKAPTVRERRENEVRQLPNAREKLHVNTRDLQENVRPQKRQVSQSAVEPRSIVIQHHQVDNRRPSGQGSVSAHPSRQQQAPPLSAVSRSSAKAENSGGGRDWAPDRSPLQKLEVTLNDISKEEKRARVQEAEMLLREAKARRAPSGGAGGAPERDTPRDVPQGSAETRRTRSTRRDEPTAVNRVVSGHQRQQQEDLQPTIEDSGLVRNLTKTHRDRLQHSTTIDNHRPDVRRLSGEGKSGFDYSTAQTDRQREPVPVAYPSRAGSGTGTGTGTDAQMQPRRASSGGSGAVGPQDQHSRSISNPQSRQQQQRRVPEEATTKSLDRNASHKAALARLTGADVDDAPVHSASKKLQKAPPMDVQHSKTRQRGVILLDPASDRRAEGDSHADVPARAALSESLPQNLTPPPRIRDPHGAGEGSPAFSSPMSSMRPVGKRQSKSSVTFKEPITKRPVDEWKEAKTARLTLADLALDKPNQAETADKGKAWWEESGTSTQQRRRRRSSASYATSNHKPSDVIDDAKAEFRPRLFIRCGPLLRYLGQKRVKDEAGNTTGEVWRGSVLIVTQDTHSDYLTPPTLRLFTRPKSLLPPPPEQVGGDLAPEYVDPIAGLTKISRIGRPLYVRPVDHLVQEKDLSQIENDEGLFESAPSLLDSESHAGKTTAFSNNRNLEQDGETVGNYQEVQAARLYADPDRDVTFWRFNIEVELGEVQQHISYRINRGASSGFWVPAKGQSMNIMFHSCNGFSLSVNPNQFSGPDPLWRDVLNVHQTRPFHVMIGGGDQIYNDRCTTETQLFGDWLKIRNPTHKHNAPFTNDMKEELESFYLNRYCMWFSQGLFSMANSQIPMVNIWDDHDIIDGFGSYPDHFMKTPVFSGVGNVAFKYYMLFQHQSVAEETAAHEPSWVLGHEPGPYIHQSSRSLFMHMGREIAFLGIDCRTERMRDEILSIRTFDNLLERCRQEIVEGETKHLLVLLGVPIAYPRVVWLENILTSRAMDPLKALNRMGVMKTGFLNKFDGGVEILDDLDDHWTASHHKAERTDLITDLQDLAAEKSVRITILGGDVHLAAVGQFRSNPKLKIPKDHDHRYMPNIISSAIVNTPPPDMLADILNKRNKVHTLNKYTEEDMIPMFTHDVDRKKRNNVHLLPRRNWCSIRTYHPGSTPPPTPPRSLTPSINSNEDEIDDLSLDGDHPPPKRRFSFTTEPANLIRKFRTRRPPPSAYPQDGIPQRSASYDGSQPLKKGFFGRGFSLTGRRASLDSQDSQPHAASFDQGQSNVRPVRPGILRRPTNFSEKAARKGNVPAIDAEGNEIDVNDSINLEGGLDVVLNVEVNQKDPAGITTPYRLLVPALWYDGSSDREKLPNTPTTEKKGPLLGRMFSGRSNGKKQSKGTAGRQGEGNWGQEVSDSESYSGEEIGITGGQQQQHQQQQPPRRRFSLFGSRRNKRDELYSSEEESDVDEHGQQQHVQPVAGFNQPPQQHGQPQQRYSSAPAPTPRGQGSYDPNRFPPPSEPRTVQNQKLPQQQPRAQSHQQQRMRMPETHDALYDVTNQPPSYHVSQRKPMAQSHQPQQQMSTAPTRHLTIGGRQRAAQPQVQQQHLPQITMAPPRATADSVTAIAAGGLNQHGQQHQALHLSSHAQATQQQQQPMQSQNHRQHLATQSRVASDSYPIQSPPSHSPSVSESSESASDVVAPAAKNPHQAKRDAKYSNHGDSFSGDDDGDGRYEATYPQPVPQRRLSKQERVLGIGAGDDGGLLPAGGPATQQQHQQQQRLQPLPLPLPPSGPLRGQGIIGNFSSAGGAAAGGHDARHGHGSGSGSGHQGMPFAPLGSQGQGHAQAQAAGYSGIEAYRDPAPRKRGFSFRRAREWLDGSGGGRRREMDEYDD